MTVSRPRLWERAHHVQTAWDWRERSWPWRAAAFGRLPLQAPMIAHAMRVRREAG